MKTYPHKIFAIIVFSFINFYSFSQDYVEDKAKKLKTEDPNRENFKDKIFTGGNLGLQFGSVTFIDISPLIGYKITDEFQVGVGATYQYINYAAYNFKTNVYGGRVFARYFILENLFAHAEYEYLNLQAFDLINKRVDVNSVLGGVGYFQRFSDNAGITAMLLYNFTETPYTPYSNPIFRVGFNIGF